MIGLLIVILLKVLFILYLFIRLADPFNVLITYNWNGTVTYTLFVFGRIFYIERTSLGDMKFIDRVCAINSFIDMNIRFDEV